MNRVLERLGAFAARRWWIVILAWLIILGGCSARARPFGGEYVNNYTVSGSGSATGLDVLNSTFPQQGGYAGQIVFHATNGTVSAQQVGREPGHQQRRQAAGCDQGDEPLRLGELRHRVQGRHDRLRQRRRGT